MRRLWSDIWWFIWTLLYRCPECHQKLYNNLYCLNLECGRFDSCMALELANQSNHDKESSGEN